jgi:hypothetical protein
LALPLEFRENLVVLFRPIERPRAVGISIRADRFLRAGNVAYGHENFFSVLEVETISKLDDISVNDSFGKRIHGFSPASEFRE